MTKKKNFLEALGNRESSGNYKSVNSAGYLGKYQMGEAALKDSGYYDNDPNYYKNDWTGKWTGKDGVYSKSDFLNNPIAQENASKIYKQKQWVYLKSKGLDKYVGKTINGVEVTESGLLAATHLKGQESVEKYLKSDGKINSKDGYGTSVEDYMKEFHGYDVTDITEKNNSGKYTGGAVPIQNGFTREQVARLSTKDFEANEQAIYRQLQQHGNLPSEKNFNKQNYSNYKNPELGGNNKIFTSEEIGKMSNDEYIKNEKAIFHQVNSIGIPSNQQLKNSRSGSSSGQKFGSGSSVKGHWVTINGNHIFIDD